MKETGYEWWVRRIRHSLKLFDVLRIDHFRGFDSYYAVPYGDPTAEFGTWKKGPGYDLFEAIRKALGEIPVIAENLGFITESVNQLLEKTGFPGMYILEFAFSGEKESMHMPHNFKPHNVAYLGTHDNSPCLGYIENLDQKTKNFLMEYFPSKTKEECVWQMIKSAYASVAELVIVQMQDFLVLGEESRINYPSQLDGNWTWRMTPDYDKKVSVKKMKRLAQVYFRC